MNHIHNKTEKVKPTARNSNTEKMTIIPTLGDQKPTLASQKAILEDKNPTTKRKKTTRSGNAFIRSPKQNLLIMRHKVILRFD